METFNLTFKTYELVEKPIRPYFEIAKLFVNELNKTAGQPYTTKQGKKGKTKVYTESMVMKDLKKLGLTSKNSQGKDVVDVHKSNGFFGECEKSSLGFRFYYMCKLKQKWFATNAEKTFTLRTKEQCTVLIVVVLLLRIKGEDKRS